MGVAIAILAITVGPVKAVIAALACMIVMITSRPFQKKVFKESLSHRTTD